MAACWSQNEWALFNTPSRWLCCALSWDSHWPKWPFGRYTPIKNSHLAFYWGEFPWYSCPFPLVPIGSGINEALLYPQSCFISWISHNSLRMQEFRRGRYTNSHKCPAPFVPKCLSKQQEEFLFFFGYPNLSSVTKKYFSFPPFQIQDLLTPALLLVLHYTQLPSAENLELRSLETFCLMPSLTCALQQFKPNWREVTP